jgi:hypothetical protein
MWHFILSVLFICIGFVIITLETDKYYKPEKAFISTMCICIGTICMVNFIGQKYPKPIDVYRGKTTLQITYKDNIPIDTVVVFKK